MPKTLIIPGSFCLASSIASDIEGCDSLDIWLKDGKVLDISGYEYIIASSLGASHLLTKSISSNQKLILINPLVVKRSFVSLIFRDIRFFMGEGIEKKNLIPVSSWFFAFGQMINLLKVNVLSKLRKIPKENITIIRGMKDDCFCDLENAELIKKEGWNLVEVEAKHNWNKNMADMVKSTLIV